MKSIIIAGILLMSSAAAASPKTALVIHGGAGVITRAQLSAEDQIGYEKALNAALDAGNAVLQRGGSARDAVIASVTVLEDSPLFNAGKGAVYNAEGGHELDASLMEGHTGKAGAVAGLRTIKNPILLAEAVMQHSTHVLLAGEGAEHFADTRKDIVRVAPEYFDTEHRYKQLMKAKAEERQTVSTDLKGKYFGTVGAVALDRNGHIAAATSTGGMTNKRWSRIGDSPIIGAGTYANEQCGVSATGWGEFFIRAVVAHDICARMMYRGDSLAQAAEEVLLKVVPEMGGDGGVVALDRDGNVSLPFNTEGMYRGWIRPDGSRGVAIFSD
ncbi:isoaspartyl peptidase/L-asparaginase family protein [Arenimonas sp.]|jgi:beta-aspartyl-peptidase (threonine type)|uniref:isoaspartyl peptidase/L-asparaginase family protein n=1 Tax=Arenimonas sp. TaxID=1872635 RepID=UPI0037BFDE54